MLLRVPGEEELLKPADPCQALPAGLLVLLERLGGNNLHEFMFEEVHLVLPRDQSRLRGAQCLQGREPSAQ